MKRRILLPNVDRDTENQNAFQCQSKRKKAVEYKECFKPHFDRLKTEDVAFFRKINYLIEDNVDINVICVKSSVHEWITNLEIGAQPNDNGTAYHRLLEEGQKYPVLPVIDRSYIQDFLRGPIRSNRERPCSNPNCVGVKKDGLRCRELLLPGDKVFPDIHGSCFLCELYKINKTWLDLDEKDENEMINMKVLAIHRFTVKVNIIGEYKLSQTIPTNPKHIVAIYGPVPLFNINNYTRIDNRFQESETLVFQLAQKVLKQTRSCHATQAGEGSRFVRSNHIGEHTPTLVDLR